MDSESDDDLEPELVGTEPEKRNWKGIIIAILVILAVIALIVVAVLLITPEKEEKDPGEPVTFEEFISGALKPREFDGKWLGSGEKFAYLSKQGEVILQDVENNDTSLLVPNSTFRQFNTKLYIVSSDNEYVLIGYDIQKRYRHSYFATFNIYSVDAKEAKSKLVDFPYQEVTGNNEGNAQTIPLVKWSSIGSSLVFVKDNNLYYQKDPYSSPAQLTASGSKVIFNGIPDWLYEEEILGNAEALWWSPDATKIAYMQINNTLVPTFKYPVYGDPTNIYGGFEEISYPKAGDPHENILPQVKLFVASVETLDSAHIQLKLPDELEKNDHYIKYVSWLSETHLIVTWLNRLQNRSVLLYCEAASGVCQINHVQTSSTGWLPVTKPFVVSGGKEYIMTEPVQDGNQGHYPHLVFMEIQASGKGIPRFITQGLWEVTKVVGHSAENRTVYYIATTKEDSKARHLFEVKIPGINEQLESPKCLSCYLESGCKYIDAEFSLSSKNYLLHCLGPSTPSHYLNSLEGKPSIVVEGNEDIRSIQKDKAMPEVEYIEVPTDDEKVIYVKVYIPRRVIKRHITMYPLVIEANISPGVQSVTYQNTIGWELLMGGNKDVVYAKVDTRGSAGRGDNWLHAVYGNLGTLDKTDLITAAKYLVKKLSFVDDKRVAVWGKHYGGFLALQAIADPEAEEVFSQAIAVAPITDWRYHDVAFTEKFMDFFKKNGNGYTHANLSTIVEQLKDKSFYIVHGTADQNVHFQHTAQFIKALTNANVDFRLQVYTDKSHDFLEDASASHFYTTLTSYLIDYCWDGGMPRELIGGEYIVITPERLAIRNASR